MTSPDAPLSVSPPVPATLALKARYRAWLAEAAPWSDHGAPVAGERVRAQLAAMGTAWERTTQRGWMALQDAVVRTPERVWLWSDHHLWHQALAQRRPFADVAQMNQALLDRARAVVAPTDWLVFLGDLTFGSEAETKTWLDQCPGHKAIVLGNHDVDHDKPDRKRLWRRFEAVTDSRELILGSVVADSAISTLWLTHYPLWETWVPAHVLNLHGHIHQHTLPGRRINLSVEHTDYAPKRLTDVLQGMSTT